jgi:TIR domain
MNVFISYAQADKTTAKRIAEGLKRQGLHVWDDSQILPGHLWAEEISRALRESDAMVVLVTPNTADSRSVRSEIDYALSRREFKNKLIPVIVGPPENIPKRELPWILWELRTIRLPERGNQDSGIRQIAQTLLQAA